jgi:hypothetical protein
MPAFVRPARLLFAALLWLGAAAAASAEWLVYELKFAPVEESVNFSHYSGAYLVAPLKGGPASIILTTEEGGRFYAHAEGGGCATTQFEELAAVDALIDCIFRNRKHARFLP